MLKIRLMRMGAKKRPFYRVVVVDERAKRTGGYIENVGTYNPLTEPKEIKLKQDRIDHWLKQGAQKSDGFLRILGEAPQRLPRKPKKEKAVPAATPAAAAPETSEAVKEENAAEEPVNEVAEAIIEETPVTEPETVSEEIPADATTEEPVAEVTPETAE